MTDAEPTFFATPEEFRVWLEVYHETTSELLVGFYKVKTGIPSMTWSQSVDEALCFGWIDGKGKHIDDKSRTIRFTPRRKGSIWSAATHWVVSVKRQDTRGRRMATLIEDSAAGRRIKHLDHSARSNAPAS